MAPEGRSNAMSANQVTEKAILEQLHQIPEHRWGEVWTFMQALQPGANTPPAQRPVFSGTDLAGSELIGIWADRTDIADSREFARQLRRQAEQRRRTPDAAGH
jgi:hypothetical protein